MKILFYLLADTICYLRGHKNLRIGSSSPNRANTLICSRCGRMCLEDRSLDKKPRN